jgi:hypothetical protein
VNLARSREVGQPVVRARAQDGCVKGLYALWNSPRIVEGSGYAAATAGGVIFSKSMGDFKPQWL